MSAQGQVGRFIAVGLTTVAIDFAVYSGLAWSGMPVPLAKAVGFLAGASFAYSANRVWTFRVEDGGTAARIRFAALYLATLLANVAVNSVVYAQTDKGRLGIAIAFLVATAASATMNFLGMRWLVFTTAVSERQR